MFLLFRGPPRRYCERAIAQRPRQISLNERNDRQRAPTYPAWCILKSEMERRQGADPQVRRFHARVAADAMRPNLMLSSE